jgi:hypothetical protein
MSAFWRNAGFITNKIDLIETGCENVKLIELTHNWSFTAYLK